MDSTDNACALSKRQKRKQARKQRKADRRSSQRGQPRAHVVHVKPEDAAANGLALAAAMARSALVDEIPAALVAAVTRRFQRRAKGTGGQLRSCVPACVA